MEGLISEFYGTFCVILLTRKKLDQGLLPLILGEVEHEGDLEETKYQ